MSIDIYDSILISPHISSDVYTLICTPKERVRYFRDSMIASMEDLNELYTRFEYLYAKRYGKGLSAYVCYYDNTSDEDMFEDNCIVFPCPRFAHTEKAFIIRNKKAFLAFNLFWDDIEDVQKNPSSKGSNKEHFILYYRDKGVLKKISIIFCVLACLDRSAIREYKRGKF